MRRPSRSSWKPVVGSGIPCSPKPVDFVHSHSSSQAVTPVHAGSLPACPLVTHVPNLDHRSPVATARIAWVSPDSTSGRSREWEPLGDRHLRKWGTSTYKTESSAWSQNQRFWECSTAIRLPTGQFANYQGYVLDNPASSRQVSTVLTDGTSNGVQEEK